ncbi:MAG: hypothetical protein ACYS8Y_00930 [Planctomycetota bacterium]|jgi:hypothetical protein
MSRQGLLLAVLAGALAFFGTVEAASHDVAWTFDNSGVQSYVLQSFEPNNIDFGVIGAEDPNLTLHIGKRYQVTVINYNSHPFQAIAKGAAAAEDTILLSMGATVGSFENDPNVIWDDNGTGTITFTFTQGLYNAMTVLDKIPGYRCGIHVSNMRGNFNICLEPIPGDVNADCRFDFVDFATIASHWLECNLDPPEACW